MPAEDVVMSQSFAAWAVAGNGGRRDAAVSHTFVAVGAVRAEAKPVSRASKKKYTNGIQTNQKRIKLSSISC